MSESQVGLYDFAGQNQIRLLIEMYCTSHKDAETEATELTLCSRHLYQISHSIAQSCCTKLLLQTHLRWLVTFKPSSSKLSCFVKALHIHTEIKNQQRKDYTRTKFAKVANSRYWPPIIYMCSSFLRIHINRNTMSSAVSFTAEHIVWIFGLLSNSL